MLTDEELMARACAGDRGAFEALVENHWPLAERVARGILRDAQLAQDVAQDTFADIYVQRARYRPQYAFEAYVSAIARHKSIDLLRKLAPLRTGLNDTDVAQYQTPEGTIIQQMFHGALLAAVERLPPAHQRMIKAYALEGQSYQAIAQEQGVTVAQVKVTLHRIRKALRRAREEWEA